MARIALYRKRILTEFEAEIDDADYPRASLIRWSVFHPIGSKTAYARGRADGVTVYLHRFLLGAAKGQEIDHIDGDGLNNKRCNLRFVSHRENIRAAFRLPGRYGTPTIEELDDELAAFEAKQERVANRL